MVIHNEWGSAECGRTCLHPQQSSRSSKVAGEDGSWGLAEGGWKHRWHNYSGHFPKVLLTLLFYFQCIY